MEQDRTKTREAMTNFTDMLKRQSQECSTYNNSKTPRHLTPEGIKEREEQKEAFIKEHGITYV